MKRIIAVALLFAFMMPVAAFQAIAAEKTLQAEIVNTGNKMCPISGDPVSGKDFVIYNGKRYGLCCPMCEKPFLKDPQKYIDAMWKKEIEVSKSGAAAAPVASKSKKMKMDMSEQAQSTGKR